MTRHTDAELLRGHVAGNPDSFGELFGRHRDRLWAVAVRALGDPEEAAMPFRMR
jgi:RNA polymerase sigma-70 factor, ECF subfamily